MQAFDDLVSIMHRLRAPGGCPWDREQTRQTLKTFLLEETYEAIDAIDHEDEDHLCEELGDVLTQVVFHAEIGAEKGTFSVEDVCKRVSAKLVRRHPHVFGDVQADTAGEVLKNWERLKREERKGSGKGHLESVPKHLPSLLKAARLTEKAARVGFDWDRAADVAHKLREEAQELSDALDRGENQKIREELGDLLFVIANLARKLEVDPEAALQEACLKFTRRFHHIERTLDEQGTPLEEAGLEKMDALWDDAKAKGL